MSKWAYHKIQTPRLPSPVASPALYKALSKSIQYGGVQRARCNTPHRWQIHKGWCGQPSRCVICVAYPCTSKLKAGILRVLDTYVTIHDTDGNPQLFARACRMPRTETWKVGSHRSEYDRAILGMAYRYAMPDVNIAWSELKAVGKQTSTLPLLLYSVSKQDEPILTC